MTGRCVGGRCGRGMGRPGRSRRRRRVPSGRGAIAARRGSRRTGSCQRGSTNGWSMSRRSGAVGCGPSMCGGAACGRGRRPRWRCGCCGQRWRGGLREPPGRSACTTAATTRSPSSGRGCRSTCWCACLRALVAEIAADHGWTVIELAVQPDHVHLFVRSRPTDSPHLIVRAFKGRTSRVLRQEFPALRRRLPTLWTRSYFCGTAGNVSAATIRRYITAQKGV